MPRSKALWNGCGKVNKETGCHRMEAPHILIVYGQVKYGSCAAIVAERCLAIMSSDNLLYQMQPQNVGRVGIRAGIGEIPQNRFGVASAVVPDFQRKLSVCNFCRYPNVTAGGIVPDAVIQEVVHGPC